MTNVLFGQKKKLNIYTDERIELLNTIQYLSGYPILNQSDSLQYREDIDKHFKEFKNHSAILLNKSIYRKFLGFDRAVNFILHYRLPNFELITPFTGNELVSLNATTTQDTLKLIVKEFKKFYNEARFNDFYKSRYRFYESINKPIIKELQQYNVVSILESYYRKKNNSYNMLISPMLHDGGYGAEVVEKGKHNYFAIIGPVYDSINKIPVFDTKAILSEYVLHEMSHSFCNSIINSNWEELTKLDCLFKPIEFDMKKQAYGNWKVCLYEHLVRANEIILNEIIFGQKKSDELRIEFINDGKWIYIDEFIKVIKEYYLKDKKKYKTQNEIMPLIIEKLKEQTKNYH
jgi:hypothetical protein